MSVEAITWALRTPLSGTKKILLIGLANHATAEFDHARPAISTLATYTHIHERNVQKALRELEADGWIECTGAHPVKGRRDRAVNVYRLCLERGGADATSSENGVALASERGGAGVSNGVALAPPEPSFNRPEERPKTEDAGARVAEVWDHYQAARKAAIPRSNGCQLGDAEKKLIRNALKVRAAEDCKAAIDGLFRSDYHVQGGYIGIKYALLGGGRSPDPATTMDRLANGRGSGSRLKDRTFRGLSFDELTPAVQANVREAASMGLEVWDGGREAWQDRDRIESEEAAEFVARRNGSAGVVTAETFLDD